MHKTDQQLKHDIENELDWDPRLRMIHVSVTVQDGATTLLGSVDTYPQKADAMVATKRVFGVRSVTEKLVVKLRAEHKRTDADILLATRNALAWDVHTPTSIISRVQSGIVTLEGQVKWNFQREAAEHAVGQLVGVVGVQNLVGLRPEAAATQVKEKMENALQRRALRSHAIKVDSIGSRITLTGHAPTWQSVEDATDIAWAVPGVTEVVDQLRVQAT